MNKYHNLIKFNYILIAIVIFFVFNYKNTHSINNSSFKKESIPLFNFNTQHIEPFTQIGLLYKNDDNLILPLYGRRTHVRSNTWNYYTVTNDNIQIKVELNIENRQCLDKIGCKEMYTDDTVYISEYNGLFTVKLY